jgi:uncharacterized protein YcbK (DUF882 family)
MGKDYKIAPNLTLGEFQSKDATDIVFVHPALLIGFQALREEIAVPLRVLSGYRSAEHNAVIGGSVESRHLQGMAIDLTPMVKEDEVDDTLAQMHIIAKELEFGGIKWYQSQRFLHVDVGVRRTW